LGQEKAAALLAGLLVFDPSLHLMVLTKENVASHAVPEHLVSLQLPDHIQGKMGRLVGYYEQNRRDSYTLLDILPSNQKLFDRNRSLLDAEVVFSKNVANPFSGG